MTQIDPLSDAKVIDSWHTNASPWTDAVRDGRIESRRLITDRAIVDAVMRRAPASVLDIGCGEGWLSRELAAKGIDVIGVDVVPGLIERADAAGGATFRVASYEEIAAGELHVRVDVAVANFAFIGEKSVEGVIRRIPSMLNEGGSLIVQTLHPVMACGDPPYVDGWRKGSWAGFSDDFTDPAPWYFRTIESWVALVVESGMNLVELREPLHPATGKPASLILAAKPIR